MAYLPPYSPDLNPIEQLYAKLKTLLRKAAELSISAHWDRIRRILDRFPPQECLNHLRHSGYVRPGRNVLWIAYGGWIFLGRHDPS